MLEEKPMNINNDDIVEYVLKIKEAVLLVQERLPNDQKLLKDFNIFGPIPVEHNGQSGHILGKFIFKNNEFESVVWATEEEIEQLGKNNDKKF